LAALLRRLRRDPDAAPEAAVPAAVAHAQGEMLSLVLTVCVAIFAVKGFIAYRDLDSAAAPPQVYGDSVAASLARVVACCAEDFAVGLGCFVVALAVVRRVASPRWRL